MNKLTCMTAVAALLIVCIAFAGCTGAETVKTATPATAPTAQPDTGTANQAIANPAMAEQAAVNQDSAKIRKVVFLRHGESQWNKENKFTGWTDVDISGQGVKEAHNAGALLLKEGYTFDAAYTSVLKRAIRTLWITLDEMNLMWIPVTCSWRLNERHYGALQGLNKAETAAEYGDEQVFIWRRSYAISPPALSPDDERNPANDPRYSSIPKDELPLTESLKDTVARVKPYWENEIAPQIKSGKKILVVGHGNSIRALVKILDNIPDDEIAQVNIPTASPLVYELDENLKPIRHYYLGNQDEIEAAMEAVAKQGTAKK